MRTPTIVAVAALAATILVAALSSSPASTQDQPTGIPLVSATGCTDGTLVNTSTYPTVDGPNNDLVDDCQALVALQNHWVRNNLWSSHPLKTWGTTTQKIDTWAGITISSNRVTTLDLISNSLTGSIPAEIGKLTNLTNLKLGYNRLTSSIPTELGNLTNLTTLDLISNRLTGSIPAEIGKLTNLTSLDISGNHLTGSIPAKIGNLTNLTTLQLYYNRLTGSIPAEIGNLTNLTYLQLGDNRLTGSIPAEISKLTNLTGLDISNNKLTNSIPAEIGKLTNLTSLDISSNHLTGSIPIEIGNLTNLTDLRLGYNSLTGSIPAEIGNLTNLTNLDYPTFSDNLLTGSIPAEIGNLTNLTRLVLSDNQLTGSIPAEIGNLTNLTRLVLSDNQLTGSIPAEIGNLTNLTDLQLDSNQLSGSIPAELESLAPSQGGKLEFFSICPNQFTGTVPTALRSLRSVNVNSSCVPGGSTTSTTTTSTTTTTAVPDGDERSGPLWNTLSIEQTGTTPSQIRQTLGLASNQAIYAWNTQTQTWQRLTNPNQPIPADTMLTFLTEQAISQANLEKLNLARGTQQTTLTAGWNIISIPQTITRNTDDTNFLLADELTNCDTNTAVIAIANYSTQTQQWQIWLPCNPASQTRLTTGANPPYRPLTAIAPTDTTYIYSRSAQTITWNPDTQTYQTSAN